MLKKEDIVTLNKIIDIIYNIHKSSDGWGFDVEYGDYNGKSVQGIMEDYEIEDMERFLNEYPFMKLLDYGVVYELQKHYNSEWLCAGWCGCASPREIIERFGVEK